MPLLLLAYILNYLDRGNIGFAAGILSLGYCTFEIPSNLTLYRHDSSVWIARDRAGVCHVAVAGRSPGSATWLTLEQRIAVENRIGAEPRHKKVKHFGAALKDTRVLLLALIQFGFTTGSYGVGIWLPQIIKAHFRFNRTLPDRRRRDADLGGAGRVDCSGNLILTDFFRLD